MIFPPVFRPTLFVMDKTSFGWGGDSNPAQQPQELQDRWEESQTYQMPGKTKELKWVIVGKKDMVVFEGDAIEPGFSALGIAMDHFGPVAHGTVTLSHMWTAQFTIEQTNIDLDTLYKQFKKWVKNPTIGKDDIDHPFHLSDIYNKDGIPLPLGKEFGLPKTAADPGSGWQTVDKLWVNTDDDYRTDIQKDYPGQDTMRAQNEKLTEEPYQCLECGEEFDNYTDMLLHVSFDHPKEDPTGDEYEIRDNDEFFYPDNEMSRQQGEHGNSFGIVSKKDDEADIPGPMPFIYDIVADRIRVGEPGDEKVDIGEYNSFGMVEGYYTPERDLIIATQTSVPYTINHVKKLWNYMYPEYEVKHIYVVHVDDGKKVREKVSNDN